MRIGGLVSRVARDHKDARRDELGGVERVDSGLGGAVRDAVAAGAERTLAAIAQRLADRSNPTSQAIATLSTMIGALLLARSISNEGLRTQILMAAQDAVHRLSQS